MHTQIRTVHQTWFAIRYHTARLPRERLPSPIDYTDPTSSVLKNCTYLIPNEALLTQGNATNAPGGAGDVLDWLMTRKGRIIRVYEKRGYRIVDNTTNGRAGSAFADVISDLRDRQATYVWAHFGHGSGRTKGNLVFTTDPMHDDITRNFGPDQFAVHHSLREIALFSCWAGHKRSEWEKHAAPGGDVYLTRGSIRAALSGSLFSVYPPLSKQ